MDIIYFARSEFSRCLVHKEKFWIDIRSILQVKILKGRVG